MLKRKELVRSKTLAVAYQTVQAMNTWNVLVQIFVPGDCGKAFEPDITLN
jgi:hypothetical protein